MHEDGFGDLGNTAGEHLGQVCFEAKSQATILQVFSEWAVTGSNRRLPACKAGALPAELTALPPRW